jgi:hypothetical protein
MEHDNLQLRNHYRQWLNLNGGVYPTDVALLNAVAPAMGTYKAWIPANGNTLPPPPVTPIELHPYLQQYPFDCSRSKLIIGTFPPISYLCDQLGSPIINPGGNNITPPKIPFFHGNKLDLWKLAADAALTASIAAFGAGAITRLGLVTAVLEFLQRMDAWVTDIVNHCQRKTITSAADVNLFNIELNLDLVKRLCKEECRIKKLIFTNSVTFRNEGIMLRAGGNVNTEIRDAFSLFLRACQVAGIAVELKLWEGGLGVGVNGANGPWLRNMRNKLVFRMRLTCAERQTKEFVVVTPPSPSGFARRGLPRNAQFKKYLGMNPNRSVDRFREDVWSNALLCNNDLLATWQPKPSAKAS